MSRLAAILFALVLTGLVIVVAATEPTTTHGVDYETFLVNVIAQVLLAVGMLSYCGFAALHSTQHVQSPQERSVWLINIIGLNVLGSCWYYVTTYQLFRKAGQGGLMRLRK
jgi:hypothetical protein